MTGLVGLAMRPLTFILQAVLLGVFLMACLHSLYEWVTRRKA